MFSRTAFCVLLPACVGRNRVIDKFAGNIGLIPCAFLHNYKESGRSQICHSKYQEAINDAPTVDRVTVFKDVGMLFKYQNGSELDVQNNCIGVNK